MIFSPRLVKLLKDLDLFSQRPGGGRRGSLQVLCVATCRFNQEVEPSAHVDRWMPNELFRLLAKQEWIALPRLASAVLNLCLVDSLFLRSELWKLWIPTVNNLPVSCHLFFSFSFFFKADNFLCIIVEILMPARQTVLDDKRRLSSVLIDFTYNIYYEPNCAYNPIVRLKCTRCKAFMVIKI